MKHFYLFGLLLFSIVTHAQRFEWATTGGYATTIANGYFGTLDLAKDSQNNLYTADQANLAQQCQGDTVQPVGGSSSFIYKFNSNGELLNLFNLGGQNLVLNLEVGENDNLYILLFTLTSELLLENQTITGLDDHHNYVFKFSSNGDYISHFYTGYSNTSSCMMQYANESIYVQTGQLKISRLNEDFEVLNEFQADGFSSATSATGIQFKGSTVLSNGDVVFSALSLGTLTINEVELSTPVNVFLHKPFLVMKCNVELEPQWNIYLRNFRDPDQKFIPMASDVNDDIYINVQVTDSCVVGNDTIFNPAGASNIGQGGLIKLNALGEGQWAKTFEAGNTAIAWSMCTVPGEAGVMIGGGFGLSLTLDAFNFVNADGNAFIAYVNSNGVTENAFAYLSPLTQADARFLLNDGEDHFFVSGRVTGSGVPIFSCTDYLANRGFYVAKFSQQSNTVPVPTIETNGNVLTASPEFFGTVQWFLNGEPIEGANAMEYEATETGLYTVMYSYEDGCIGEESSEEISMVIESVEESGINGLSIYPNPSNGTVVMDLKELEMVHVYSSTGVLVYQWKPISKGLVSMELPLSNGIYLIQQGNRTVRWICEK